MVLITTVALPDTGSQLIPSVAYEASLKVREYFFKLLLDGNYDLGILGSDALCKFHFFCMTNRFHNCYMMDIYVKNIKAGSFKIEISKSSAIVKSDVNYCYLGEDKESIDFLNQPENSFNYIKTYTFAQSDQSVGFLNTTTLDIPIKIWWGVPCEIPNNLARNVELVHGFQDMSRNGDTDLTVKCSDGIELFAHKMMLAIQSDVLNTLIKDQNDITLDDATSDDTELLLEYIYSNSIQNIKEKDNIKLLKLADKYEIAGLKILAENVLCDQVNLENSVDMLIASDTYHSEVLRQKVVNFMLDNPTVLKEGNWKNLDDLNLAKTTFEFYCSNMAF